MNKYRTPVTKDRSTLRRIRLLIRRANSDLGIATKIAFTLERSVRQMTEKRNTELLSKCDELAAQNEVMRDAMLAIARDNRPYTMAQNAIEALDMPNTVDILRQRDARTLRDAAKSLLNMETNTKPFYNSIGVARVELERMSNELEASNAQPLAT